MLRSLVELYSLVVLAAVVLSWLRLDERHPVARALHTLTEPVLRPIRSVLPTVGGLDFSPVVLLVLLRMLTRILR